MVPFFFQYFRKRPRRAVGLPVHRSLRQGPNQRERSVRHRRPGDEHDLRETPEEELLLLYIIIEVALKA